MDLYRKLNFLFELEVKIERMRNKIFASDNTR